MLVRHDAAVVLAFPRLLKDPCRRAHRPVGLCPDDGGGGVTLCPPGRWRAWAHRDLRALSSDRRRGLRAPI